MTLQNDARSAVMRSGLGIIVRAALSINVGFLIGEFRFKGGGSEKVKLRKGKGYWD